MSMTPHPGSVIADFLAKKGITQQTFADTVNTSRLTVNQLCNGRRSLSAYIALKIEMAYGVPAKELLYMQADHDLDMARQAANATEVKLEGVRNPFEHLIDKEE